MLNAHNTALLPVGDGHPVKCSEWSDSGLTLERCSHSRHLRRSKADLGGICHPV